MGKRKPNSGRNKIPMEKIHNKSHRQVTFSKRRAGVFKKASELCTLCGVEVAIIVYSPAGKPFSFGHPEVDSIIHKFLTPNARHPRTFGAYQLTEAHRNAKVGELNMQLTQILNQLEVERKKGEILNQIREARERQCWWEAPVEQLQLRELQQLWNAMEELKNSVAKQANKGLVESLPFLGEVVDNFENMTNQIHHGNLFWS
ncbi:hypothetical protein K2173_009138 [Erythroxylum novogranatense]|uniref:MADS-box domain-containing protein n=1 Tax=Erythroxylum novogranatense TaxID=1862640 RepID=A0AAV8TFC6_9ROSI|nr:hypothetical protein K2173_009138 [Erythroxylum novogranatense]